MNFLFDNPKLDENNKNARQTCDQYCSDYCTYWCASENSSDDGMIGPPAVCTDCTQMCYNNCDVECVMYCGGFLRLLIGTGD